MNLIIILCLICLANSLKGEKRASFIIKALIDRKSYSIPLKTKFILKCSSSKFGSNKIENSNDLDEDEQFFDDHPELIVIDNLEKTKKLVNYFSKINEKTDNRIDLIGWNRTSLDRIYKAKKSTQDNIKDKKFDKMYENLYLSGKGFFQPNEDVSLFGEGQSCLLFTGFSKKDESIYSCFYKPKFDWFSLFDFNVWTFSMKDSTKSDDLENFEDKSDEKFKNLEQLVNNEKSKDPNNMPFIEKLLYLTCTYTWPFSQECYLVKQFKLTLEETNEDQQDNWANLNSHDRFKFKKLLKELMRYCHHSSLSSKLQQNQRTDDRSKAYQSRKASDHRFKDDHKKYASSEDQQPGLISEFLRHLFNDLFISVFCDLISSIFGSLFNLLFGNLFSKFLNGLVGSTISDLFNELIKDFVDPFKDLNLFHIIYILLFILIYFSIQNKKDKDQSETDSQSESEQDLSPNIKIDAHIDARIDNDSKILENDNNFNQISKRIYKAGKKRDKNLKFNIEANVTNKTKRDISKKDVFRNDILRKDVFKKNDFKDVQNLNKLKSNEDYSRTNDFEKDEAKEDNFENADTKSFSIVSKPKKKNDDEDNYNEKFKSLIKARNKLGDLIKNPMYKIEDERINELTDENINKLKDDKELSDQNLEFKGEIIVSKLGEVSYLGQFLFNLPKELEEKPLHLILDQELTLDTDSKDLTEFTKKEESNDKSNIFETNFSNDLSLELENKQDHEQL